MEKICAYCGASFAGSAQARFCSDAHRKAFNRAQTASARERAVETLAVERPGPPGAIVQRPIEQLLRLDPFAPLTDEEEHVLRVHFGYAESEKRTRAERQAVANRLRNPHALTARVTTRYRLDGTPVEEPVGPAGLSLIAFPTQTEGDLTPSPAALAKLEGAA